MKIGANSIINRLHLLKFAVSSILIEKPVCIALE